MSGPYDSYNQYPQQGGYSQQPYGQGPQYGGYNQQEQQQYPQQGYGAPEGYGPPRRQDSFGPPQAGGFQHGQSGGQFGAYDASNPQGHAGYYGAGYDQQQQQYGQQQQPYDQQQQSYGGQQYQSSDPKAPNYDANAPPAGAEGERGLMGAAAGAFGGHYLGKNAGHGLLGTLGGAIMGSILEDKVKDKKHHHHSGHGGQSSWGGGKW